MSISFNIPKEIERDLAAELGDLGIAAKEALAIEAYRRGKIGLGRLAEMLGMGAVEADRWLADRRVAMNYTAADLDSDRAVLSRLSGESGA